MFKMHFVKTDTPPYSSVSIDALARVLLNKDIFVVKIVWLENNQITT